MSEQGMEQTQDAGRPSGVEGFTSADVSDVARMSYEQARAELMETVGLSLIHISEPTRQCCTARMPSSA